MSEQIIVHLHAPQDIQLFEVNEGIMLYRQVFTGIDESEYILSDVVT